MAVLTRQRGTAPRPDRALAGRWAVAGLAALSLGMLSLGGAGPARAQGGGLELAVKATYLYKLAPFVSWPAGVYAGPAAPLVICVQGADPFGAILDRATAGQWVGGHPVAVRRMARIEAASGCQIAYVAGGPAQTQAQALQALDKAPVLTVTDEARGGPKGIVHLVLDAGKVRFSINAAQAEGSGVVISSKLLALAVAVQR